MSTGFGFRVLVAGVGLILSVCAWSAQSEDGVLRGAVSYRLDHTPIRHASILLHRRGVEDVWVQVDENGKFSVKLRPGIYDVFVATDGFDPTCRKVEVVRGSSQSYDPQLEAATVGMQE